MISPIGITGALESLTSEQCNAILCRTALNENSGQAAASVASQTRDIIDQVRVDGDNALREFARRYDKVDLASLEVPRSEWTRALDALDATLRTALDRAARNIAAVHSAMLPTEIRTSPEAGVTIGRRPDPLSRVGVYAPGGRAAYPSSLLMGAVPARVAGVGEIIVCSPPAGDGMPLPVVLAAAALANVDRVFAIGGAGAIAAMALGTATVPRVDRIVGPGNAFVAEAKLQLVHQVAIDSPAGPSELLVLADDSCDPLHVAHELLAQAEHDPDAAVIAIVVGSDAAQVTERISSALAALLRAAPRAEVARAALERHGALLFTDSMNSAVEFSNAFAPEHLLLSTGATDDSLGRMRSLLPLLRNAGTVFLGEGSSVAYGDYMTGANHVLPTAGLARAYSGLSTLDFVRWTTWQEVDAEAARSMAPSTSVFAEAEGLPAHAAAARYVVERPEKNATSSQSVFGVSQAVTS
jgi:histidinol dehydrogenase